MLLSSLHAFACAFAAEPLQPAVPQASGAGSALHLEFGGAHAQYPHLAEPYMFSPTAGLVGLSSAGWDREWQDDRVWLKARYDLHLGGRLLLQPGLAVGAAQGRFAASNDGFGVPEEWRTDEAWRTSVGLLGGLSFAGELHADPARGPFLTVRYSFSRAEAGEAHETLISRPGTSPDHRYARFRWQESQTILGSGYRWKGFRPTVGIAHTGFHLRKSLSHQIPETGLEGFNLEIVHALNIQASEYHYENQGRWAPFLELGWQVSPGLALAAHGTYAGGKGFSAGLRVAF